MNDNTASTPTSIHPCPPWCTETPGHGYDSRDPGNDTLIRFHTAQIGEAVVIAGVLDWREYTVPVSIDTMEVATPDGLQVLQLDAAQLTMGYDEGTVFTGEQARKLAALLLNAADRYDEITGA